jgi:hypothetical protein
MTVLIWCAFAVLFVLTFILFGACVEMFRDIRQLRDALGILDRPIAMKLPAEGEKPSAHGLPAALDTAAFELVLILSDLCGTCGTLLEAMSPGLPEGLLVLAEARTLERAQQWALGHGFELSDRFVFDEDERIALSLGVHSSPVAVFVLDGLIAGSTTVPSSRQLSNLLDLRPTDDQSTAVGPVPVPAPTRAPAR